MEWTDFLIYFFLYVLLILVLRAMPRTRSHPVGCCVPTVRILQEKRTENERSSNAPASPDASTGVPESPSVSGTGSACNRSERPAFRSG